MVVRRRVAWLLLLLVSAMSQLLPPSLAQEQGGQGLRQARKLHACKCAQAMQLAKHLTCMHSHACTGASVLDGMEEVQDEEQQQVSAAALGDYMAANLGMGADVESYSLLDTAGSMETLAFNRYNRRSKG